MKAFDTPNVTTGHAHQILAEGFLAIGIYLRPDRAPLDMIKGLLSVGILVFSIWEKGHPTSGAYFTANQGIIDANEAVAYAKEIGQTPGSHIFACVDFDANWEHDGPKILEYFIEFHKIVKAAGFLASVYGSGVTCSKLVAAGYAHSGFLAQSTGWGDYAGYKPHAAIIQEPSATVLGFDVDLDNVVDTSVCWK